MDKQDYKNNFTEVPMGLGMALMQNSGAMQYFDSLPESERKQVIDHTHSIRSKSEMRAFVASLNPEAGRKLPDMER